jgi:DNA-binding protein HU-beta
MSRVWQENPHDYSRGHYAHKLPALLSKMQVRNARKRKRLNHANHTATSLKSAETAIALSASDAELITRTDSNEPSIDLTHQEEYKLTKADLISAVAEKSGMTKKDSDSAVTAMIDVITETLARGENVALVGFGTFAIRERAARQGFNPRTKETMPIPASKLPAFRAGKALKEAVGK